MRQLIPIDEARDIILQNPISLNHEKVCISNSLNRVLAEPIIARENLPPFNRSPLDGYAVCTSDLTTASEDNPITLNIIEEVPAGKVSNESLTKGTAIKVTTGACLPSGADAVIPFEKTEFTITTVKITEPLQPNSNISFAGEDVAVGEQVIPANTIITPERIGMLAALGYSKVQVFRKPKIALLSTGDELINLDEPLAPGKIRNSNLYTLAAMVKKLGGDPVLLGIVSDSLEDTAAMLQEASQYDLVITTGGVSVGDYDVVKDAMTKIGAELLFWRVNIRPG
ncbi:MAG: molybdopterin molybdotransferase MoeA, partial [Bacillota bacterium]|nr:molybdopterin molybdotransferase MoeA [Bacillota bacterium]